MSHRITTVLSLCLLLGACTKKSGKLEYGLDVKDTLRINLQQEPPILDWTKSTDTTSSMVTYNITDTLVGYNLHDPELSLTPLLATAWVPSQGAKVWTFTLRKGAKWSDGVEFTGQHALDAIERLLSPDTASQYGYFLYPIKNAKAYGAGKIKDFKEVGAKLNDQGQLVIELEKPMAFFPLLMAHHCTAPVRKDVIAKFGNKWTDPANIVTNGPYKLKVWDHDKAIVLERNDDYYGEKAKIKNVLGYMINEYSTALNLMDSGRMDFQETLPFKELPQYRNKPGFHSPGSLSIYYYGFNIRKPPFDNVKVRKAFSHAIDRKQITDLLAGGQSPLTAWVPTGMFGYESSIGLNFDPKMAAQLLDEAGYKDRSKFPKFTISFNTNENHQRVAENVQSQLKKSLGLEAQLAQEEWKVYIARLHSDPGPVWRMGWLADYPDPDTFMSLLTSTSENNYTGWKNKKYDELVEHGASEMDKVKRKAIYAEAQKILTENDVPAIPLYSDVRPILLSERVQNFPINALNRWEFKGVSFK